MSYCYNYPQGTHDLIFITANPTLVDFSRVTISVTRCGDLLDFGQLFIAYGNN